MKTSQLEKRKRNKTKFINWSRKYKADGSIRYTFISGDYYWVVKINSGTSKNRNNIAKILISQRKKFMDFIYRGTTFVGGHN